MLNPDSLLGDRPALDQQVRLLDAAFPTMRWQKSRRGRRVLGSMLRCVPPALPAQLDAGLLSIWIAIGPDLYSRQR